MVHKLHQEAINPKPVEERPESNYVGVVGERSKFIVTVEYIKVLDSVYGYAYLHIMVDDKGNDIRWFGSNRLCEKGETLTIKGTVKKHEVYDGRKQTILSRCAKV